VRSKRAYKPLVAAVGNAREFKSGRELSAWLGLVPRQHSSGSRNVLLGISKRDDLYLRTLLIHGARSAVRVVERRRDPCSVAISRLKARRGPNVAAVALANRNARVLWVLLKRRRLPPPRRSTHRCRSERLNSARGKMR
jgi:transposase